MTTKLQKSSYASGIGFAAGSVGGLIYAFTKKKKFGGYVGQFFLWGIIAGTVAWLGAQAIIPKDKE
jgi:hypothetical protein